MDRMRMATRIARIVLAADYVASTPIEKVMGEILTSQMGITNAPEKVFKDAVKKLNALLEENDLELDLKDPDIYPHIQAALASVV